MQRLPELPNMQSPLDERLPQPFGGSLWVFTLVLCSAFFWYFYISVKAVYMLFFIFETASELNLAYNITLWDYFLLMAFVRIIFVFMSFYSLFLLFSRKKSFVSFFETLFILYISWQLILYLVVNPLLWPGFAVDRPLTAASLLYWTYLGASVLILIGGWAYLSFSKRARATFVR